MKAMLRLTLAVAILAGLPAIATSTTVTIPRQPGGGSYDLQCAQFCAVALCPQDKPNCGPLPGGGCGCSGGFSIE